jgi:predicted ATP-grasp superfamily ATP-dependent carboligase
MSDFPTLDRNYGDEVIVVVQARAKHRTMHRIFEDNDARILRLVNDQFIGTAQSYHLAVAREDGHKIFTAVNALRPTRRSIEKFEYRVVGDSIEKLLSINKPGKALLDHIEKRI